MKKYNHDRPLSDFSKDLKKIRGAGFNPIAVTQMWFEDTFVFETEDEANTAYDMLEKHGELCGWWHGRKSFEEAVKDYEKGDGNTVRIYWLED